MAAADLLRQIKVNPKAPEPSHAQISSQARRLIREGYLLPGESLPGITQMARSLKVGRSTIVRCLQDLAAEGLIVSRWGAGNFVAQAPLPTTQVIFHRPQPSSHHPARAYYDQIFDALRAVLAAPRRISFSYIDGHVPDGKELLALLGALRADSLLVYRPMGEMLNAMREASAKRPAASMFYPVPDSNVDTVLSDPEPALRSVLETRWRRGQRAFAFIGVDQLFSDGNPYSPYMALRRTYLNFTEHKGLAPHMFLLRVGMSAAAIREELRAIYEGLPPGVTVVTCEMTPEATPLSADAIGYTEYVQTVEAMQGRCTVLHLDIRRAAATAAELLLDRVEGQAGTAARQVRLIPEILERKEATAEGKPVAPHV